MKRYTVKIQNVLIAVIFVLASALALHAQTPSSPSFQSQGGLTTGGGNASSPNFGALSASGLMVVGKASSPNFKASSGLVTPVEAIILALLDSPLLNASLTGAVTVSGTASNKLPSSFQNYSLEFARGKNPNAADPDACNYPGVFQSILQGTKTVIAASLGSWDTSLLAGTFTLKLKVTDTAGNFKQVCAPVSISNNATKSVNALIPGWKMVSIPVGLSAAEASKILTIPGLQIYRWDPAAADSAATSKFVVPATIEPGKSYWVKNPSGTGTVSVTGALIDQTQGLSVPLSAGWNMVANPYIFSIAWGAVKVAQGTNVYSLSQAATAGIIGNFFYSFSGSFTQNTIAATQLQPQEGYYVYAYQPANLILMPDSAPAPSSLAKAATQAGLSIKISAAAGDYKDADNTVGFSSDAQDAWDENDVVKAPLAPRLDASEPYLTLYFPHEDGEEGTGWEGSKRVKYANDIRKANKNRGKNVLETWKMVVATNIQGKPVDVNWTISNPDVQVVTLKDKVTGASVDMTKQSSYSYTPGPTEVYSGREFEVIVLPKGSLFASADGSLFAGKVYNFPNPDRIGNATFRYAVNPLSVTRVSIEVFNIAGKHIKTLEADPYSIEYHWNFDLSTGVYVYRITAYAADGRQESQVSKLVVLK